MTGERIKILHLEDRMEDAHIILRFIEKSKINFEVIVVATKTQYLNALSDFEPDVIISDDNLPGFSSSEALDILKKSGRGIPFILVTGTVSDEFAVNMIKQGADDYILKDRLERLPIAIESALEKYKSDRDRQILLDKQGLLADLVKYSNDAILSKSLDGTITSWNSAAEKIFGYTEHEVLGKNILILYPSGKNHEETIIMDRIKDGFSVEHFETERLRKDGSLVHVSLTISPLRSSKGTVIGFSKIVRDITYKKLAAAKLKAFENQFRAMIEKSADMITLADADGTLTYGSPSITKVLGYEIEEFFNLKGFDLIHPSDIPVMSQKLQDILQTPGKSFSNQHRIKHKNGDWVWTEGNMTNLLHDPDIGSLVSNFRDITERKRAEQALMHKHGELLLASDKQTAILDALPANIALLNEEGIITAVNESWKRFGEKNNILSPQYNIGDNYLEIARNATEDEAATGKKIAKGIEDVINGSIPSFEMEYPCHSPTEQRWFMAVIAPLIKGKGSGAVVMHINITARKLAEMEILKLNRLYAFISAINQSIVYSKDPLTLLAKVCSIAREIGRFQLAWIGLLNEEDKLEIISEHRENSTVGLPIERYEINMLHSSFKDTLVDMALRTGFYAVSNNILDVPDTSFLEEEKKYSGLKSNIVLPLKKAGKIIGVCSFYSDVAHYFDASEIRLLEEAIMDISLALENLEIADMLAEGEKRLRRSYELMTKLTDEVPIAIYQFEMTTDGKIYFPFMSKGIERILPGITSNMVKVDAAITFSKLHPDDLLNFVASINYSRDNLSAWNQEYRTLTDSGEVKWMHASSSPEKKENGAVVWYGYIQDITEHKKAEAALHELNENLELKVKQRTKDLSEANSALETFNYSVSHDLRAPLRSINGFANIIQTEYSNQMNAEVRELFEHIIISSKRMDAIINDLLELAKYNKATIQTAPVDMDKLVCGVWGMLKFSMKHNAQLIVTSLPIVEGDVSMLEQVLMNLISNAAKYSSKKKSPLLKWVRANRTIRLHFLLGIMVLGLICSSTSDFLALFNGYTAVANLKVPE